MKIAVTCIQLIRDIENFAPIFNDHGIDFALPEVKGQFLEGQDLINALEGCVGVIAGDDQFSEEVLRSCPGLKVISKWGIGIDGIDLRIAEDLGIKVTNTPGMFDDEVADVSLSYVVSLARQLAEVDRAIRAGVWMKPAGTSLAGSTLGIVGLGAIGRALAKRALCCGMRVIGSDPGEKSQEASERIGVEVVEFVELLQQSDFISINAPLNDSTLHLFDDSAFGKMRRGVKIVNTGRGAVVSSAALVDALRSGQVAGAALDVMEEEPIPVGHPLLEFDSVIFGSHNASNTLEASQRTHSKAIENLLASLGVDPS